MTTATFSLMGAPAADEAQALGLEVTATLPGGVTVTGGWHEVWRELNAAVV